MGKQRVNVVLYSHGGLAFAFIGMANKPLSIGELATFYREARKANASQFGVVKVCSAEFPDDPSSQSLAVLPSRRRIRLDALEELVRSLLPDSREIVVRRCTTMRGELRAALLVRLALLAEG